MRKTIHKFCLNYARVILNIPIYDESIVVNVLIKFNVENFKLYNNFLFTI
jgi:hypothetical protein